MAKKTKSERLKQAEAVFGAWREHWEFPSSSSDAVHITLLHEDGKLTCSCPAWINKKEGKNRDCPHQRRLLVEENFIITHYEHYFAYVERKAR